MPRWFPHTSTPRPRTCPQGRFRDVDATHVPAAGPASRQRRVHFRRSPEAVHGPNPFGRRPIGGFLRKESRPEASPSGFRPPPLVPGLFWFRARVILPTDGPTHPIQRLTVPGQVPTFPHPEPPLLLAFGRSRVWELALGATHALASPHVVTPGVLHVPFTFVQQLKRQNTPRARNLLFLQAQGVTRFSGLACAQNSGTIRATRPQGRGTL